MSKYFHQSDEPVENQEIGLYMDYYIKKSEGLEYVTPGAKKFEWGLLDHVKKIREGGEISSQPSAAQSSASHSPEEKTSHQEQSNEGVEHTKKTQKNRRA